MTQKLRGVRSEEYAYYVHKLRQNVGLETWIWRQIVTSQTGDTKDEWPPNATEWTPPIENFLRTPLVMTHPSHAPSSCVKQGACSLIALVQL